MNKLLSKKEYWGKSNKWLWQHCLKGYKETETSKWIIGRLILSDWFREIPTFYKICCKNKLMSRERHLNSWDLLWAKETHRMKMTSNSNQKIRYTLLMGIPSCLEYRRNTIRTIMHQFFNQQAFNLREEFKANSLIYLHRLFKRIINSREETTEEALMTMEINFKLQAI